MGVQGAAIATLVSQLLNFLLILLGFVVCLRRMAVILCGRCILKESPRERTAHDPANFAQ